MRKSAFLLFAVVSFLLMGCSHRYETTELNIIPAPVFQVVKESSYTLNSTTRLTFENLGQNSATAKYVSRSLRKMHFVPTLSSDTTSEGILLKINDSTNMEIGDEGYILEVSTSGIVISANTEAGLFYGYQTLLQMLPPDISSTSYSSIVIPCCTILDHPRFAWRGFQLDVSRHFFEVDEVKRILDVMAMYKYNRFVWHLADDAGWRLESERFPMLNSVGSWRPDRGDTPWGEARPSQVGERCSYGGAYSRQQVDEIVQYASQLHIEVIPELSLPSQCAALLASYPQLACGRDEYCVQCSPNDTLQSALCLGNDSTISMVMRIVDEVADMFPSEHFFLYGSSITPDSWHHCPRCRYRVLENSLGDESALPSWFAAKLESHLAERDKHLVVMGGTQTESLPVDVAVVATSEIASGLNASRLDHQVIMSPEEYCSFDIYQADLRYQPRAVGGMLPLQKVYAFDPVPTGTNSYLAANVLGGQCVAWTAYMDKSSQLEYMVLPRLCAMAECLWSPKSAKDWTSFRYRIEFHKFNLKSRGYAVCPGSFRPLMTKTTNSAGQCQMTLQTEVMNTYVFFTTDGTDPTQSSKIYIAPVDIQPGTVVKTLSVYDGEQREGIYEFKM